MTLVKSLKYEYFKLFPPYFHQSEHIPNVTGGHCTGQKQWAV